MKKILLISAIIFSLFSCGSEKEKKDQKSGSIEGEWELVEFEVGSDDVMEMQDIERSKITFDENNVFRYRANDEHHKGTWETDDDKIKIEFTRVEPAFGSFFEENDKLEGEFDIKDDVLSIEGTFFYTYHPASDPPYTKEKDFSMRLKRR